MSQSITQFHPCPIFGIRVVYGDLDRRVKTRTPSFPNINVKNKDDSFFLFSRLLSSDVVVLNQSTNLAANIFITSKIANHVDNSTYDDNITFPLIIKIYFNNKHLK